MYNIEEVKTTIQLANAMEKAILEKIAYFAKLLNNNGFNISPFIELDFELTNLGQIKRFSLSEAWRGNVILLATKTVNSAVATKFYKFNTKWLNYTDEQFLGEFRNFY